MSNVVDLAEYRVKREAEPKDPMKEKGFAYASDNFDTNEKPYTIGYKHGYAGKTAKSPYKSKEKTHEYHAGFVHGVQDAHK